MLRVLEDDLKHLDGVILSGVSLNNEIGGYINLIGQREGIKQAITRVREVFADWLPQTPATPPKKKPYSDY